LSGLAWETGPHPIKPRVLALRLREMRCWTPRAEPFRGEIWALRRYWEGKKTY